ncbi:hypothetical protein [Roseibacillus persicicus]|uniref:Uncharacterized protein n=1 Tax=Roseibacillus persicicus TaxID=454148 RepID=A0A918TVB7_9BACT|nr:hypothetical protein [Roseibacillus persicicus]GHC60514.1 hypothetical protein GCM10007100_29850 [Roseibacillus persicicus]
MRFFEELEFAHLAQTRGERFIIRLVEMYARWRDSSLVVAGLWMLIFIFGGKDVPLFFATLAMVSFFSLFLSQICHTVVKIWRRQDEANGNGV